MEKLIIVIGRGNGGTRLMSETLSKSGVYMGTTNESGDLVPAEDMYAAVKIAGSFVSMEGKHQWDFSKLIAAEPPAEFIHLVNKYLFDTIVTDNKNIGFKLPETLLALPFIFKMFPNAYYIFWTRDVRDTISGNHITDNLADFNIPCEINTNQPSKDSMPIHPLSHLIIKPKRTIVDQRLESWIYQKQIVESIPRPDLFIDVKFEDFVLNQEETLNKISDFLSIPLVAIPVDQNQVGAYKNFGINIENSILDKYNT